MALVKKNIPSLSAASFHDNDANRKGSISVREAEAQRKRARTLAKQQQAAERIAAATGELSSGINEAASASEQLRRAANQISAGAEEASGAAQESTSAFHLVTESIGIQLQSAEVSESKVNACQLVITSTSSDVANLIANVTEAGQRQQGSVAMVSELEAQASNIGDIVKAVARIADQTNLLALNAAIEAARAGKHGKGFAVVADEVRTLAETSERSAKQIQDLVGQIQQDVKSIAEGINKSAQVLGAEVENGKVINSQLERIGVDFREIARSVVEISAGAKQSDTAAQQAMKGSQDIAAAALQQAAAAEETAKTVSEQAQALAEAEQAAQALAEVAEELKNSTDVSKSAEVVASSAEQLSSAVEEINRASAQIMGALEEISKGAQVAAAASEESSTAIGQIEKGVEVAQQRATVSGEKVKGIQSLLIANKDAVGSLINGIAASVKATQDSIKQVRDLDQVSRRIDKIVEAITTVSIQTNMLAVNGSVEAARAGEFGKGFVVVSTDIRNLARDSAENADRIKDLVKAVQDQIALVSADLEDIVKAAIIEAEKAKITTASLAQIEADVAEVERGAATILAASGEISTAIGQAKKGVDQIASAAQESEKAAGEAAGAAEQQSKGARELAAAIEEISSLADELQSVA
ncbi:methyl-accepting chemotaxis protein [Herbaspirillum camelliae]|uniref:methyl-accepting chemotaxis protein n=1 Tax=Herbaspirillum camelliae TaxID=1892903 RepID=UPI000949DF26|nr:methyl-accepting chemotaxis protein [Herbaspirillum camelliae]